MRVFRRQLVALVAAAVAATAAPTPAEVRLPSIGDPVDQVLSPREEAAIGARMMAQARQQLDMNRDPEIADYLDTVGTGLATHVDDGPAEGFTFFLVHDPRINAFAAPGGYVGINSGLFLAARNEGQLASVLAHEIAHVTQRHIAKALAANQRNQYKTLAAVLAGLILSGRNPEAAQAAITTGVAAEAQRQINYTRSNEYEADRIGIGILARAGYEPRAMAGMFELLMQSAGSSADAVPEFLRTHPLSSNRIAEAQGRAADMAAGGGRADPLEFHLMQRRLQVIDASEPRTLARRWESTAAEEGTHAAAARTYGLALLERRNGEPAAAADRLERLRRDAPDNLHYGLALARCYRDMDRVEQALELWRHFEAIHPASYAVAETGAELLTAAGRPDDAVGLLTAYVRRAEAPPPEAWRRLAEAAEAAGRSVRSHESLGEYYTRIGAYDRAVRQLDIALERAQAGTPDALRLEARLEQVRSLQRERMADTPVSER